MIPDRCYATVYDETINFFKANGALDVTTAGSVANVGLMAQKAEEYGSHPTTFEAPADGTIRIVTGQWRHPAFSHDVEAGDIWRCLHGQESARLRTGSNWRWTVSV